MEKKNLVNVVVNTTALKGTKKENVMKNGYYNETSAAIECCLITGTIGFTLPLIVTFTDRLVMHPGDLAFLLVLTHLFTSVIAGGMLSDIQGKAPKAIVGGFYGVTSLLVGTALFRCLTEALESLTDYASLPAFIIVSGVTLMSFGLAAAFASSLKLKK
jgi:hypothetical protein